MRIERLTAEDELMLRADAAWPQDVGAIGTLEGDLLLDATGNLRLNAVRQHIASRLHLVPRFRQVVHYPRRGLGPPLWRDDPRFDVDRHVGIEPLPAGSGEAGLLLAIERLRRRRLDMSRPLWEMWFLPGLADGRIGLFVRMHHAIGDGRAAMTILSAFFDPSPDVPSSTAPPWTPAALPSARQLLIDNLRRLAAGAGAALSVLVRPLALLRRLRSGLPAMRELMADKPGSDTSLNRLIGPDRNLALVRGSVALVRRIGRRYDATVNDVLLAAIAGGLRELLRSRGEPVAGVTVRIFVPVSLRRRLRGTVQGNRISQMVVPLRLGVADPGRRLALIAAETARRKAWPRVSLGGLFGIGVVRRVMLKSIIRQRVNVTSASIPGPRRPLYLAGARVLELFPVLNLLGNEPLGVGALSYAGALDIAIVADRDTFPDVDLLAAALRRELDLLDPEAAPERTEERVLATA
ncbi:MAG TPA: wax ester/triacylglycerol synthase family O-acyltransferase [Candidatus Limnocylindria bacterium]